MGRADQKRAGRVVFEDVLRANGGHGPGFDILRLALSAMILIYHSFIVCYGEGSGGPWALDWLYRLTSINFLPMFFALSGFLVAGSYERTRSLVTFLAFRALRIVPALATEIVISAVLIGALVTSLPLADYYASPQFMRYFLNIFGVVQFYLPGVFETNPTSIVNKSLWTIPAELICYGVLSVIIALGLLSRRRMFLLGFIAVTVAVAADYLVLGLNWSGRWVYPPAVLLMCFLAGALMFLYRDVVVADVRLALLALAAMLACPTTGLTMALAPVCVAYFTVWLGLRDGPVTRLRPKGDYSYGIYLYAFPIQQLLAAYLPAARVWYVNAALAFAIVCVVAIVSWRLVERPALRLKRHVPALHRLVGVPVRS